MKFEFAPHKIKLINSPAAWLLTLLVLVGLLLKAAVNISEPPWICPILVVISIIIIFIIIWITFKLQTVYRPLLQEDIYYSKWLKQERKDFKNFHAENTQSKSTTSIEKTDIENQRINRYQKYKGLFLIHTWRPSKIPGQTADIVVKLCQHKRGPLSENQIEKVEYTLGSMFFNEPVIKTNSGENFKLEVSAYAPMLCLARIHLKDGTTPIILERYIDFNTEESGLHF